MFVSFKEISKQGSGSLQIDEPRAVCTVGCLVLTSGQTTIIKAHMGNTGKLTFRVWNLTLSWQIVFLFERFFTQFKVILFKAISLILSIFLLKIEKQVLLLKSRELVACLKEYSTITSRLFQVYVFLQQINGFQNDIQAFSLKQTHKKAKKARERSNPVVVHHRGSNNYLL